MGDLVSGTQLRTNETLVPDANPGEPLRIEDPFGRLPFGDRYRGHCGQVPILVTVIDPALSSNEALLGEVFSALHCASQVEHGTLLPIYGFGEAGGYDVVVEADPKADTLATFARNRTARGKSIDPNAIQKLAEDLCNALGVLHQRLIHGFVHSDTVLVSTNGRVFLGGAGFGTTLSQCPRFFLHRQAGRVCGVAPEQLFMPPRVFPGTDVFAVAALFVELATGRGLARAGQPVRELEFDGSDALADCLERATSSSVAERPLDVATFVRELSHALERTSSGTSGYVRGRTQPVRRVTRDGIAAVGDGPVPPPEPIRPAPTRPSLPFDIETAFELVEASDLVDIPRYPPAPPPMNYRSHAVGGGGAAAGAARKELEQLDAIFGQLTALEDVGLEQLTQWVDGTSDGADGQPSSDDASASGSSTTRNAASSSGRPIDSELELDLPPSASSSLLRRKSPSTSLADVPLVKHASSTSNPVVRAPSSTAIPAVRAPSSTAIPAVRAPSSASIPGLRSASSPSNPVVPAPSSASVPLVRSYDTPSFSSEPAANTPPGPNGEYRSSPMRSGDRPSPYRPPQYSSSWPSPWITVLLVLVTLAGFAAAGWMLWPPGAVR